jgi:hypothetical protein
VASISKTVRPKRSNNRTVAPSGYGLTVSRGTPVTTGVDGTGTVLFTETFANASFAARGWYDISSTDWVASPAPSGLPGALRMTWTAGQTNATTRTMRRLFSPTDRIYIKYQQSFGANWVGSGQSYHPHMVMCLSELDGDYGNTADSFLAFYCETNYQSGNRPAVKFQDNQYVAAGSIGSNVSEARATSGANGQQGYADSWDLYADSGVSQGWYNSRNLVGAVQMAAGNTAWHTVEVEVVLNTVSGGIGQTDGICRYWWDGVLVWERTNLIMRTGTRPTLRFNQFLLTPYIGDGSPVTQTTYMGDLTVATARTSGGTPPASAALTGTSTSGWYESEVVSGGDTVIVTLTNDTWVAAGSLFDAQRRNILDGIVAASSPTNGWNNSRSSLAVTNVVRTSDAVATITLGALASYSVTASETLTVTVPGSALSGGNAVVALPSLMISEGAVPTFDPYGNRPASYTTVTTDYAFSAVLPTSPSDVTIPDGSGWAISSAGSLARVSDATAPRSSPYAAQWTYPPSLTGGNSVGKFYRSVGSANAFYISLAVWHDSNFEFNSVSNKFVTFFNSDGGTDLLETSHNGSPLVWQFERPGSTTLYGPTTAFGTSITEADLRGTWWNLEIQYVGGVGTGSVRVWAGRSDGSDGAVGQLVMQHTGINVYLPAPEFQLDSTWGGGTASPTRTSYRRIDHFYMSHP